jgi:hypothetical protein
LLPLLQGQPSQSSPCPKTSLARPLPVAWLALQNALPKAQYGSGFTIKMSPATAGGPAGGGALGTKRISAVPAMAAISEAPRRCGRRLGGGGLQGEVEGREVAQHAAVLRTSVLGEQCHVAWSGLMASTSDTNDRQPGLACLAAPSP